MKEIVDMCRVVMEGRRQERTGTMNEVKRAADNADMSICNTVHGMDRAGPILASSLSDGSLLLLRTTIHSILILLVIEFSIPAAEKTYPDRNMGKSKILFSVKIVF